MISTLLGKPPNADVHMKASQAGGLDITFYYHQGIYWIAELPVTACITFIIRKKVLLRKFFIQQSCDLTEVSTGL